MHTATPMTILVVDDDELTLDLMGLSLGEIGCNNFAMDASGQAALARLDDGYAADVIFCDLNMPQMDGVELIRHLARRQFAGGVILLSGEDWRIMKTCEELGLAFGLEMLGSLQKPFQPDDIARLLSRLHARKAAPSAVRGEPILPDELRAGIESGQIVAWFQPQLCIRTLKLVAVEALARWQHPTRGLVPPMAFIPIAEEHGLIDAMMAAVYQDAMHHVGRWNRLGYDLRVAVNLSTDNLNSHKLPEQLERWSREAGVAPQSVMIEITESRLSKNIALSLEILTRLRLKGFGLSIDDFGTGYSSMEQLHRMPFNELKIDRGFVHGAATDSRSRAVFESSVELGRKLRMSTVAEGVETAEDFNLTRELEADLVQGFYFSKPLPPDALEAWIAAGGAGPMTAAPA
jgi:EAL domain-containing protein (putative c-di-GMP-specific phosphodiesterase class I)/CheY-like chemotaxis protein